MNPPRRNIAATGFTLVEALITIAIIGIMAALLISAFSNTAQDTSRMIARQQQAALQSAVSAWVNGDTNRVNIINATAGTAKLKTIEEIRTAYNAAATTTARYALVEAYLDDATRAHFASYTTGTAKIKSSALKTTNQYLSLPVWTSNSYPQVLLLSE
jgi:prepilin-type N-terminal cleavage/methylation domain-containing protein